MDALASAAERPVRPDNDSRRTSSLEASKPVRPDNDSRRTSSLEASVSEPVRPTTEVPQSLASIARTVGVSDGVDELSDAGRDVSSDCRCSCRWNDVSVERVLRVLSCCADANECMICFA